MKILVTGAAGFIGSHVAERLAYMGHDVIGIDSFEKYYSPSLKELNWMAVRAKGVATEVVDLAEADLRHSLEGAEIVYHLAAQPGLSPGAPFSDYVRNNIIATQRLIEASVGVRSLRAFVHVSTSSVYGADATGSEASEPKPASWYGVTKLAGEQLVMARVRDNGFPACSFRLFSVFGPRERPEKLYPRLIRCILEDSEFPLYEGSLDHVRSFTYVTDVVDALALAPEKFDACRGEIINIGNERAIRTADGIRIVEEILGRKARIRPLPRRSGDQLRTEANIDKAHRLLGYSPRTSPKEGLEAEIEWYRAEIFGRSELSSR